MQVGIWLDMFAINQHPYDGKNVALIEDDVARLGQVVAAVEATLFVMDSGESYDLSWTQG